MRKTMLGLAVAGLASLASTGLAGCYQVVHEAQDPAPTPTPASSEAERRNAALRQNAQAVQIGVERYATAHDGRYPATDTWIADLANFLEGSRLPASPWARGLRQENVVPLMTMAAPSKRPAGGAALIPQGSVLGAGKVPSSNTFDAFTYGALLYQQLADDRHYVIYAIGEKDGQAYVAHRVVGE